MSARCVFWAFENMSKVKDGTAIALLLKLADQANDDGICWPSRQTLAAHLSVSQRSISAAAKRLEEMGLLLRNPRLRANGSRTSNVYQLVLEADDKGILKTASRPDFPSENLEPTKKESGLAAASGQRFIQTRDELWDAVSEVTEAEPESSGEKSRRGKVVKELYQLGATGDEIRARAARYRMKYAGAALTDTALLGRWGELSGRRVRSGLGIKCPECDELMMKTKLAAHRYDKHDVGSLCLECSQPVMPEEAHQCRAS